MARYPAVTFWFSTRFFRKPVPAFRISLYVRRAKNDAADAAAICEAVTRPSMRFVPVKMIDQQAALALHRTRDLLVRQRMQLINALRAHRAEPGVIGATALAMTITDPLAFKSGREPAAWIGLVPRAEFH